jgi:GH15 family glucan-1,4-alpha-glucosidase
MADHVHRNARLGLPVLITESWYYEEARAWRDWLLRAIAGSPHQVQIMYGVGGERWLPELTLPWLKGYADSKPVRIGNAACDQMQIDVFGEIADRRFRRTRPAWRRPSAAGPYAH